MIPFWKLRRTPFADDGPRRAAGRFGLALFIASLAALFVASIVGYVVVRWQLGRDSLWPADLPPLPWGLTVSTAVLFASSATLHVASRAAEAEGEAGAASAARWLWVTLGLGAVFLLVQAFCWLDWTSAIRSRWAESEGWRFALTGFYVLTGLHGVHVLGGLLALGRAIVRVRAPAAVDDRVHVVRTSGMYWHFLGVVWLVLLVLLIVTG